MAAAAVTPAGELKDASSDDPSKWPCSADMYEVLGEIGQGAFATVYRARVKGRTEEVAIKIIDLDQFNTNWDEIRKEISVMRSLNHENVVKIYCSFVDEQDLWIVMPLLAGGSCAAIMKQLHPTGFKDEALIATILKEALQGLQYFHKDGRIHRDIKAGNILIGADGSVELADFGVAGTLMENGDRKKQRQTFTGTPCWMAPEVMEQSNGYDTKADIWSFGITAMELGYGRAPYAKYQPMKVLLLTLQEDPPTCDVYNEPTTKFGRHYHSLIAKCLRKDPTKRPTAKKLLEHKFFKQAKNAQYIVDNLIRRLPPVDTSRPYVFNRRAAPSSTAALKPKPVSIPEWSFGEHSSPADAAAGAGSTAVADAGSPHSDAPTPTAPAVERKGRFEVTEVDDDSDDDDSESSEADTPPAPAASPAPATAAAEGGVAR